MDPLSAGASVLAFVGILNSLQSIYQTLASIKDGPQSVRLAANSVHQLRSVLQQLQQQQCLTDSDSELYLRQCAEDVAGFVAKVNKLQASPTESRKEKLWKRVKAALSEKDLENMHKILTSHSAALGLRLILLQRYGTYSIPGCFGTRNADGDDRDVMVECRDQIVALKADVARQQQPHPQPQPQQNPQETTQIQPDQQQQNQDTSSNSSFQATPPGTPALQAQMDMMLQMLQQLQHQIPAPETTQPRVVEVIDEVMEEINEETVDVCKQLNETINEICQLVGDEERILRSEDAEEIITRIARLLKPANFEELQRICQRDMDLSSFDQVEVTRDLSRMSGYLTSSNRLAVNGAVQKTRPAGRALRGRRQRGRFNTKDGHLELSTTKWRHLIRRIADSGRNTEEIEAEDFIATLRFVPTKDSVQKRMLEVTFRQNELRSGVLLTIPSISVNWIRPNDSTVFRLVEQGKVEKLRRLLADKSASIRDHDEAGRSLLFYAMEQPKVCQFLIESGIDVDPVAPDTIDGVSRTPLIDSAIAEQGLERNALAATNKCRALLLEAGADPSLTITEASAFGYLLDGDQNARSIETFLKFGEPFIHIESRMFSGQTPLLVLCEGNGEGASFDNIKCLLDLGG